MSRAAAYGELVAGILDVRDQAPTERFDAALRAAVAAGRLDPRTAAELRWLQRESVQALVEHARTALPAALLGIDEARSGGPAGAGGEQPARDAAAAAPPAPDSPTVWARVPLRQDVVAAATGTPAGGPVPHPGSAEPAEPAAEEPEVRRLLVAGLTSLAGPSSHG